MAKKTRGRQPFIRRGAETHSIFLEDLRGMVWNASRDRSMSWKELALKANVTSATVSKFAYGETKRPVFRTVFNIVEALDIRLTVQPR